MTTDANKAPTTVGKTKFYQGEKRPSRCSASSPASLAKTPVSKPQN